MNDRHRALLHLGLLLFLRDFRYRYRQSYLGYLWAVSRVLLGGIPIILVGSHFDLGAGRTPVAYAVYALTGYILWQIFWDSVISPQWIGRRLRKIVAEVPFRLEALLVAAGCYVAFNTSIYMVLLTLAFLIFKVAPPVTLLLGLAVLPLLVLAGLAIGAALVPLTYVYLDFRFGLPFLASALLWTAPIFYVSPEAGILRVINMWNPLTYIIDLPRSWFIAGLSGRDVLFVPCILAFIGLFTVGLRFYYRAMPAAVQTLSRA